MAGRRQALTESSFKFYSSLRRCSFILVASWFLFGVLVLMSDQKPLCSGASSGVQELEQSGSKMMTWEWRKDPQGGDLE